MKASSICVAGACTALLSLSGVAAFAQSDPPAAQTSGWAVVSARGTVIRGQSVKGVRRHGRGQYEVDFSGPVNRCVYTASIGGDERITEPSSLVVARAKGVANGVMVGIYDLVTLLPKNNRFMLNVSC